MRYILFLFLFTAQLALGQKKIFVAPTVEKSAEWIKIPYQKTIKKAAKGNREALANLVAVYGAIEGKDLALHSRTVLEVMHKVGDSVFSKSVFLDIDRKYWPILKKHLPSGQPLLQQTVWTTTPLSTDFPVTWAMIAGDLEPYQNMHCGTCAKSKIDAPKTHTNKETEEKAKKKNKAEPSDAAIPAQTQDTIDPKLLKPKSDKPLPPVPPEVDKMIEDILKKQQEQKTQGGG
jgi:hypothetical protein